MPHEGRGEEGGENEREGQSRVAIMRLKRVAAGSYKDDIPTASTTARRTQSARVVGAGPPSPTVARDLAPARLRVRGVRRRRTRRRLGSAARSQVSHARDA